MVDGLTKSLSTAVWLRARVSLEAKHRALDLATQLDLF
jgi:hypothetical protein